MADCKLNASALLAQAKALATPEYAAARAEVQRILEQVLAELEQAQREASRGVWVVNSNIVETLVDLGKPLARGRVKNVASVDCKPGDLVCVRHEDSIDAELEADQGWVFVDLPDGMLGLQMPRIARPTVVIGDVVEIYGSRMECVQMTSDTLTFCEVGE